MTDKTPITFLTSEILQAAISEGLTPDQIREVDDLIATPFFQAATNYCREPVLEDNPKLGIQRTIGVMTSVGYRLGTLFGSIPEKVHDLFVDMIYHSLTSGIETGMSERAKRLAELGFSDVKPTTETLQ